MFLIRLWRGHRSLWKTLSDAVPAEASLQELCDHLAVELNIRSPRVVCSPYFTSPFLAGVADPVVHLCSDAIDDLSEDQGNGVRDVLIHELAHLKRRDVLMRMFNNVVLSLFFFQPLLRRLVTWIENSAEDVCDDYAMSFGARRDRYAGRLVDLAECCDFPIHTAVGIASGKSMLIHRVTRIMDSSRKLSMQVGRRSLVVCGVGIAAAVISVCLLLIPRNEAMAGGQQVPPNTPSDEAAFAAETAPLEAGTESDERKESAESTTAEGAGQSEFEWPQDIVRGIILGNGGPIAGAEVYWWRSRVHDAEPMQPVRVVTDANGQFELTRTAPNSNDPAIWDMREEMLIRAKGYAFKHTNPAKFGASVPIDPSFPQQTERLPRGGAAMTLSTEGQPISGRLVDIEGQPIAGAKVRIRWFSQRRDIAAAESGFVGALAQFFTPAPPKRTETDLVDDVFSVVQSIEQVPLRDALPLAITDDDGKFILSGLPAGSLFELLVERQGIQSTNVVARNYDGDQVLTVEQKEGYTHDAPTTVYPADFQAVIGPSVAVVGTVTDVDTGQPIVGAIVRTNKVAGEKITSSRERQHLAVRTDAQGRYRIDGLPVGEGNGVEVFALGDVPYMPIRSDVNTSDADAVRAGELTLDFQLKIGIWAEGRVYELESGEPFQGEISYYWFRNRELEATYKGNLFAYLDGRYFTDFNGRFRIPILPTAGVIGFNTGNRNHSRMAAYSRGYGEQELSSYRSADGSFPYYDTVPMSLMPGNYNRLALVEPQPNDQVVELPMPLAASQPIPVTILNPDGTHVTNTLEIYGGNERWGWVDASPKDFVVEDLLSGQTRKVFAFDRNRNLVGGTIVDHDRQKAFKIQLAPAGSVRGRLLDRDGAPLTNARISVEYGDFQNDATTAIWARQQGKNYMPSELTIDEQGRFEVRGLSAQWQYSARVVHQDEQAMNRIIGYAFRALTIELGESRDLGDVVINSE